MKKFVILETKEPKVRYLQASESGLIRIKRAIEIKRWEKVDKRWIKAAKTSVENLENFWNRLKIPEDDFIRICQAVDVDWEDIRQRGHFFTTLRTKIKDAEILKASLRDLGIVMKTEAEVRGDGQRVLADVVAVLEGGYDIGFSQNTEGSYDIIADLWGVAEKYNQTELIQSICRKYAVNKTLVEAKQRGVIKKMKCPRCTSSQIGKYGYFQGKQNYICRNCGTQFTDF